MEVQTQTSTWIRGKVIGKGSYGVVTLGFRDDNGEVFAVKSAEISNVPSNEALDNEVEILRSLSSPYIVKYYGDEETTSFRNLFMEYLPGGDLARGGKVDDVELIRSYTWCLVMALKYLQEKKIVHCDIKGKNLILLGPTNKRVAKLADFGSAKRVVDESDSQRLKTVPRGSPLWMAPEVVRGEPQVFGSDIWSVGCTVIEMFTGKPAWQDKGAHTLYKIGYSDELPEYPAQLPELARDFLNKCLVREVSERWSCDQLLQHPFLVPVPAENKVLLETSPRSILDWDNLNFSDEDDDHVTQYETYQVSARGRIGKLAMSEGVNWESDGWIEVRNLRNEMDQVEGDDGIITLSPGVNWEFYNDNDKIWINLTAEAEISGGNDDGERDSTCRQVVRREKNLGSLILLFTLYCFASIGLLPNVIMLFLIIIMLIYCFWIKIISIFCNFEKYFNLYKYGMKQSNCNLVKDHVTKSLLFNLIGDVCDEKAVKNFKC